MFGLPDMVTDLRVHASRDVAYGASLAGHSTEGEILVLGSRQAIVVSFPHNYVVVEVMSRHMYADSDLA